MRLAHALTALALAAGCRFEEPGHAAWQPPVGAASAAAPAASAPCAHRAPQRSAWFGDLHVHTGYSMDARSWDLPRTPDDAYAYATGEAIELPSGGTDDAPRRLRIDRPLDFAAVTDHAEWMGEVRLCTDPGSAVYASAGCRIFRGEQLSWLGRLLGLEGMAQRASGIAGLFGRSGLCGDDGSECRDALLDAWSDTRAAAERWYDRSAECRFTSFLAWEYTYTPARSKTHRNVILANEHGPELPLSWIDTPTPSQLWRRLEELCLDADGACDALSIPHNPNLANGRVFAPWYLELPPGEREAELRRRARLEPLVEIMQVKGESECRNGFSQVFGGPDELCDFEKIRDFPGEDWGECPAGEVGRGGEARRGCISPWGYARYGLLEGMRAAEGYGVNPFRVGFVGSTDGHAATPGSVAEWDPALPLGRPDLSPRERLGIGERGEAWLWSNPGGLVGLWAEENRRESLFAAMRRREAFATSGPRIRPRLFAGWELPEDLCAAADFASEGYARGVPMGGVLPAPPAADAAPLVAVAALRDPGTPEHPGGLLQRIQIVKVWLGADGSFQQRVYEVAGDPHNGAGVDLDTCAPRGAGAESLCAVWRDPDFDPARPTAWYARTVENPSCRWSTRQCLALPPDARPDGCSDPRVPRSVQERAWTSPVWYEPPPA